LRPVESLKAVLRRASPSLYAGLIGLRRGPAMRALAGFGPRSRVRSLVRKGQPFSIDLSARMGLGATFASLVALHHHFADYPGLRRIVASNPLYLDEGLDEGLEEGSEEGLPGDVLDLFLDRLEPDHVSGESAPGGPVIPFTSDFDFSLKPLAAGLSIQRAHDLFHRHYRVKQNFLDEAEAFCRENFGQAVGVHFRGSDKRIEANVVAWEAITGALDKCLDSGGTQRIFAATDEADFLAFIRNRYGARVCALDCRFLANGLVPAHFREGSGLTKGREALLTMLILARCSVVIRGASFLSGWAKILNPALPIVMLGKPYGREVFPEAEILRESKAGPGSR
jgi:hypothetical protein